MCIYIYIIWMYKYAYIPLLVYSLIGSFTMNMHIHVHLQCPACQVSVTTQFVDDEIAKVPAPQLVVPSDTLRSLRFPNMARKLVWKHAYSCLHYRVYRHTYTHTCYIYTHVCTQKQQDIFGYTYLHVHAYVYIYTYMFTCLHTCTYNCISISVIWDLIGCQPYDVSLLRRC